MPGSFSLRKGMINRTSNPPPGAARNSSRGPRRKVPATAPRVGTSPHLPRPGHPSGSPAPFVASPSSEAFCRPRAVGGRTGKLDAPGLGRGSMPWADRNFPPAAAKSDSAPGVERGWRDVHLHRQPGLPTGFVRFPDSAGESPVPRAAHLLGVGLSQRRPRADRRRTIIRSPSPLPRPGATSAGDRVQAVEQECGFNCIWSVCNFAPQPLLQFHRASSRSRYFAGNSRTRRERATMPSR